MIETLAISGYRSLRDLVLPLGQLTLVTGPNGSGKSSLYRALRLLGDLAEDRLVSSLALEGGLESTLWAGPERLSREMQRGEQAIEGGRRRGPIALKLGFATFDKGYAVDLGLPVSGGADPFGRDPQIKAEALWSGRTLSRGGLMAERRGGHVRVRDDDGVWRDVQRDLQAFDSMVVGCADPQAAPELAMLRDELRRWRFYDHIRSDRDAPARRPQVGTRTVALGAEGADLAAAWLTIQEIGDERLLAEAVEDAFPGASVDVVVDRGWFTLEMRQKGLLRPLTAAELSDGTLRYLIWTAALASPRPPPLLVLNEPEVGLHPDLLQPLARRLIAASERSQIVVVSHSQPLIEAISADKGCTRLRLSKRLGETQVEDVDAPAWVWPVR